MATLYIPCSASICFGSGSASVRLVADGIRVRSEDLYSSGPFVSTSYVELATLRTARVVEYCASYYPGGTREFKGSGAHFIKWALRKGEAVDKNGNHPPKEGRGISPRSRWERESDLVRRVVARVEARVPESPALSGGKVVPYHFYTDEGRWEQWPRDRGTPTVNSNGLTSWGTLVVRRVGMWFVAPARIQGEVESCKRSIPW
jgi:hypothetical protein